MTLAAPRSRQGRLMLVLAILAAAVATVGALTWANTAQADVPAGSTATFDDDVTGAVPVGSVVNYTVTVDINGVPSGTTTGPFLDFDADPNLFAISGASDAGAPWNGAECVAKVFSYRSLTCNDAAGPIDDDVVTGVFVAIPVIDYLLLGPVAGGNICALGDDGVDAANPCVDGTVNDANIAPYVVTPAVGENSPGTPHTITFQLPPNFTCQSDATPNNGSRSCTAADVSIVANPASMTLVSGPTVITSNLGSTSDVIVVVNSPQATVGTVTLDLKYDTQGYTALPFIDVLDPSATKTYAVVGAGNVGEIRHRDEPDLATEDAADLDIDPFCATVVQVIPCGILDTQDDNDDATGSFHQACIINTLLTATVNNPDITWHILPGPGSSATVNPGPNGQKIAGPDDIPCVRWSSGGTGTQSITATYDNGIDPATDIFFDDTVPLPLIKEWNDIDETHIVAATGIVGDDLTLNTLELGGTTTDWENRDCSFVPVDSGLCDRPNLDGLTLQQEAAFIINSPGGVLISAPGRSFIDYTFGNHSDLGGAYDGPVDGAEQTYSISGDCGSVRLEDPATGVVIILSNNGPFPSSATVLSSDKGVGFTFLPTDDGQPTVTLVNADCGPNAQICIHIATEEDNLFRSPPIDDAEDEEICIEYTVGPPTAKTPILAWAGQRVVVEHYWGNADGTCPELDFPNGDIDEFGVLYSKQAGPGSFTAALQSNGFNDVDQSSENVIVDVDLLPTDDDQDGQIDANSGCISRVIYESEDQGEVDISAYVVDDNDNLNNADPRSQQVAFVIYYMKFEDLVLGLVPGARSGHNSGTFSPANPIDPSTDVTSITDANVSADVLARVRVRGWVLTDNCPARDSAVGSNGEFIPANRCIFPDDWNFKAGGALALETRPNFDVLNTPPTAPSQSTCSSAPRAAGPFSLLDTNVQGDTSVNPCGDSLAPNVSPGHPCLYAIGYSCRETVFPNGIIDKYDANMPAALVRFLLTGSGFLHGADKDDIYTGNSNLFYATHIPAEPWIAPINQDLSGYQWNSWGGPGAKSGQYDFWNDLADHGAEVISCPGASPCAANVGTLTGGYQLTKVYTDNHGEAMTWVNGDANLTFADCVSNSANAGHNIVLLNGYYCEEDDVVGNSTLTASVDYPDKRKHFAIDSNDVTITWLWGGIKDVTIEPGATAQFNYVVLHLTDRDGFCSPSPSLHPVIGERVTFLIDSPNGVIFPDNNGIPAALLGTWTSKSADVTTFDTDAAATSALTVEPVIKDGECQAWIHVSESLLGPVNVIITAYDPEGTVVFDVIINEPTPTPAPTTPTPTPANQANLWADIDCDDDVNPVDSLKVLRHDAGLSITQTSPCPDAGESVLTIWDAEAENELWGDADCTGEISPVDSLKILRYDAGLFYIQQEPCPDIGSEVLISAQ